MFAIPALFREHAAAVAGKHPFAEKHLETLESLGAWILRHVTPDGGRPCPHHAVLNRKPRRACCAAATFVASAQYRRGMCAPPRTR
jgi:hypothetical protein